MLLHLKIRNFDRVESADIALNNLVFFVGNNNSGKTLIMQLIYGIKKELENFPFPIYGIKQSELNGQLLIRCDQDWFKKVEQNLNKYLDENKSRIVKDIFGIPIRVGQIRAVLESDEDEYFVGSASVYQNIEAGGQKKGISIDIRQYKNGKNIKSFANQVSEMDYSNAAVKETLKVVWKQSHGFAAAFPAGVTFRPAVIV